MTSQTNRADAPALADASDYMPESYLEAIAELLHAARDEEAVALVQRHGAAMLPRLSPEQLVHLTSMMEGADAAIEATALVNWRLARRASAAS